MNEAKIQQLKSEIEATTAQLDKLKAELDWAMTREPSIEDRWKPEVNDCYYAIDTSDNCLLLAKRTDSLRDIKMFGNYNCWKTADRAEEVARKMKLLLLMEQIHDILCPDYKPGWSNRKETKYRVLYNDVERSWEIACSNRYFSTFVHFDTKEHAKQAAKILNDMGVKPV